MTSYDAAISARGLSHYSALPFSLQATILLAVRRDGVLGVPRSMAMVAAGTHQRGNRIDDAVKMRSG